MNKFLPAKITLGICIAILLAVLTWTLSNIGKNINELKSVTGTVVSSETIAIQSSKGVESHVFVIELNSSDLKFGIHDHLYEVFEYFQNNDPRGKNLRNLF
jgi:hypothetical protein